MTCTVHEDVTERLVRALEQGEMDLAVVSTCRAAAGMRREFWQREPLLLMVPQDHPETRKKRASLRALRGENFLALHESHCLSQQIDLWCRKQKITRRTIQPALQLATVAALVAAGQGVSLLPAMAARDEPARGCAFLSLHDAAPEREINALRHPGRFQSRAAVTVAALARRVVAEAVGLPAPPGSAAR